jgi:hypothetical protein
MTKDDIIKLARDAGFNWPEIHTTTIEERLERFANLVAAAEREECAKLCEGRLQEGLNFEGCAKAIRARGNT